MKPIDIFNKAVSESIIDEVKPMGIFLNMPESKYHSIDAFSYSGSKEFEKSPAHYQAYKKREHKTDPDREFFKAVHLLCLEDHRRSDVVIVDGTWSGKTKELVTEHKRNGKIVVKQVAFDEAHIVASKLKSDPLVAKYLTNGIHEVSIFFVWDGVYCKARLDTVYFTDETVEIIDLKNFDELHNDRILFWHVKKSQYPRQLGIYGTAVFNSCGLFVDKYKWVFIEGKDPYSHKIRECSKELVLQGANEILGFANSFHHCSESAMWPAFEGQECVLQEAPALSVEF